MIDVRRWMLVAMALLLVAATACRSSTRTRATPSDCADAGPGNRDWYAGTPEMQRRVRNLIAEIPHIEGVARIELGRQIIAVGEPAIPLLVEALGHPDAATRGTAAWLLGFTNDPRVTNCLARATRDRDPLVGYQAAASLVGMGDPRGLCRLIQGLDDGDPRVRAQCFDSLEHRTGETFGYAPDQAPCERSAAVARWRAWAASLPQGNL